MQINPTSVYPDWQSQNLTSLEAATIFAARDVLAMQSDITKNPQNLDYIDITQDEDAETITIAWKDIPVSLVDGAISIPDYFTDTFTAGTSSYPFNQVTRLGAAIHLWIFQKSIEVNSTYNDGEVLLDYSLDGSTTIGLPPLVFSGTATLPLVLSVQNGGTLSVGGEYLSGSLS